MADTSTTGVDRLTESVRIRLAADEKSELDRLAVKEERTASAIGRRAIRHELERLRSGSRK